MSEPAPVSERIAPGGCPSGMVRIADLHRRGVVQWHGEAGCLPANTTDPSNLPATQSGYFTFLKDCAARTDVVAGDARLSMESELRQNKPQHFDLLAIDAFAGDAIPVHLLTEEAFAIYLEQLNQPSGILALHVTNGYFDLRPVIFMMAERFGMRSYWIHSKGDTTVDGGNDWILLSRDGRFLDSFSRVNAGLSQYTAAALARPWTDDYSNLLQVLKR